jgi:hypothetical protein
MKKKPLKSVWKHKIKPDFFFFWPQSNFFKQDECSKNTSMKSLLLSEWILLTQKTTSFIIEK